MNFITWRIDIKTPLIIFTLWVAPKQRFKGLIFQFWGRPKGRLINNTVIRYLSIIMFIIYSLYCIIFIPFQYWNKIHLFKYKPIYKTNIYVYIQHNIYIYFIETVFRYSILFALSSLSLNDCLIPCIQFFLGLPLFVSAWVYIKACSGPLLVIGKHHHIILIVWYEYV